MTPILIREKSSAFCRFCGRRLKERFWVQDNPEQHLVFVYSCEDGHPFYAVVATIYLPVEEEVIESKPERLR